MKLLVLLNENPIGANDDVRRAIKNCGDKGLITNYIIYPFLAKLVNGRKEKQILKEIFDISKNYQPDLILWMHTDKFKIDGNIIKGLRYLESKPVMGYWDGDIYPEPFVPVPNEVLELSAACDVSFVQGFGDMSGKMQVKGCNDIRFVPPFGDEKRFYPVKSCKSKEYNIVMIGNYTTSRNPFRITLSGTKFRKKIVATLSKKYKDKFAIYGKNWKGNNAKGIIPYLEQHKIYSKSKIALSVNNDNAKYYFSDRLPIAMLSGIPIVQNYEEGLELLFKNCNEILFFKSLPELLEKIEILLLKSQEELDEIGTKLNEYAKKYFLAEFAFNYMIKVMISKKNDNYFITNPWIY